MTPHTPAAPPTRVQPPTRVPPRPTNVGTPALQPSAYVLAAAQVIFGLISICVFSAFLIFVATTVANSNRASIAHLPTCHCECPCRCVNCRESP